MSGDGACLRCSGHGVIETQLSTLSGHLADCPDCLGIGRMSSTSSRIQGPAEKSAGSEVSSLIPSGASAFSKARFSWPANAPHHLRRPSGANVTTGRGQSFVDLAVGLGAVTLGYGDLDVETEVRLAMGRPVLSLPHWVEEQVARQLVDVIPSAEMVKFGLSGTDATEAAVRCARAYTNRSQVASVGYHGWGEFCPNRRGIPRSRDVDSLRLDVWQDVLSIPFPSEIAAIIVEPNDCSDLPGLRAYCDKHGIVLIFDEVLTGFRVSLGGWQQLSGVMPDLSTFSKALGNGYPVSAVVGKRELMQTFEKIGFSGTFFGFTLGLYAASAVIEKMQREPVVERLTEVGGRLMLAFVESAYEYRIPVDAPGCQTFWIPTFKRDSEAIDPIIGPSKLPWRSLYRQEMIRRGFLIGPAYIFSSYAHTDEQIERFAQASRESMAVLASVDKPEERLEGEAAGGGVRTA